MIIYISNLDVIPSGMYHKLTNKNTIDDNMHKDTQPNILYFDNHDGKHFMTKMTKIKIYIMDLNIFIILTGMFL